MDTDIKTMKQKFRHPDRIALTPESLERLSLWLKQISDQLKGIKLKRADLLNYLVKSASEKLTASQIKEIEKEYFDEVKFHEWALRELRRARKLGLPTTYAEIIGGGRQKGFTSDPSQPKLKKQKAPENRRPPETNTPENPTVTPVKS